MFISNTGINAFDTIKLIIMNKHQLINSEPEVK